MSSLVVIFIEGTFTIIYLVYTYVIVSINTYSYTSLLTCLYLNLIGYYFNYILQILLLQIIDNALQRDIY
mgnify:FL=1